MEQLELLQFAADILERLRIRYMVVGSYGSAHYGEPRMTRDIDIVADVQPQHVNSLSAAFAAPRFYLSSQAMRDAIEYGMPFNILEPATGHKIDMMLPRNDEWGRTQLDRRQQVPLLEGRLAYFASPEDIILGKLVFFAEGQSEKHLRDIKGMMKVLGKEIDRKMIEHWAEKLGVIQDWNVLLMLPESPA